MIEPRFRLLGPLFFALALGASAAAQETDLRGWEDTPGLYGWLVQPEAAWQRGVFGVEHRPVRDRVLGASALALAFAPDGDPATFVYRPPGPAFSSRAGYAGISIWVKGDGSEGVGVLGIGDGGPRDPRVTFLLRQKSWQPVRVTWGDFRPPVLTPGVPSIFLSVTPETKRPAGFTVDALELVRGIGPARDDGELHREGERSAKEPDPPRPADLSAFVKGRERLAEFRAKLDAKKPLRVLVVGDGVARGDALWNVPPGARPGVLFPARLERALKAKSPDATVDTLLVDGPEAAAARLVARLRSLGPNAVHPDVVVIEMSCSPPGAPPGAISRARDATKTLFEICQNAGVETLVLPIPQVADPFRRVDYASMLAEEAARTRVARVDFAAFAAARRVGFEGEYYAAPDALNVQGHAAAADLLARALVNP